MNSTTRITDENGRTSRAPDGNVGHYYFWLGDAFEPLGESDDASLGYDAGAAESRARPMMGDGGTGC